MFSTVSQFTIITIITGSNFFFKMADDGIAFILFIALMGSGSTNAGSDAGTGTGPVSGTGTGSDAGWSE